MCQTLNVDKSWKMWQIATIQQQIAEKCPDHENAGHTKMHKRFVNNWPILAKK